MGARMAREKGGLHGAMEVVGEEVEKSGGEVEVVGEHQCDRGGLPPGHLCLQGKRSSPRMGVVGVDPRQGYYSRSCSHLAGSPVLLPSCRLAALLITPVCGGGGVALQLPLYLPWLQAATTTDLLRTGGWQTSRALRRQLQGAMRRAGKCRGQDPRKVYRGEEARTDSEEGEQEVGSRGPRWGELGPNLQVVTQCGVEVRRRGSWPGQAEVRHHPLAGPLQGRHHLRRAPPARQGAQLQVPAEPGLSVAHNCSHREGQGGKPLITCCSRLGSSSSILTCTLCTTTWRCRSRGAPRWRGAPPPSPPLSRFSGDSPVRTIISGSDQLRLTFHSDYRGERRGFGLTFQPVEVRGLVPP